LYSAGVPNKAVFKVRKKRPLKVTILMILQIVERNSRKPDFAKSDLHALVAATKIGARRIIEMCERFGADTYGAALDELLERNKIAIRKLIATTVPDEPIFFEDYIDDDGFGLGPWRIAWCVPRMSHFVQHFNSILLQQNDQNSRPRGGGGCLV
jgi:5-oxoprolinase (ATP-hydrolysing)